MQDLTQEQHFNQSRLHQQLGPTTIPTESEGALKVRDGTFQLAAVRTAGEMGGLRRGGGER